MKTIFSFGLLLFFSQILCAQILIQSSSTSVSCFGGSNGTATANASGGTAPYDYTWSNGQTGNVISNLPMGAYTVTVTDNTGITASKSLVITQPPLLGATLNGQPQICTVAPDGFVYVIPTGGTPPHTYSWSNGKATQLNNYLSANNYTVTVTDTRGCTVTGSYTVGFLGLGLYLFTESEVATCPNPFNGSVGVTALSGIGPYQYQWSNGATDNTVDSLMAGDYVVSVTDVNGCSAATTVRVEQEDVDTTVVQVLVAQCVGETYDFESTGSYQVYHWTVNDPKDTIVAGEGTTQIQVKWGVSGQKSIAVAMNDTVTHCATSTIFTVAVYSCVSDNKESTIAQLNVTPNPFDQYVNIQQSVQSLSGTEAQIFNAHGKLVARQSITGKTTNIDTARLCSGVYWLKLSDGKDSKIWKMIKV